MLPYNNKLKIPHQVPQVIIVKYARKKRTPKKIITWFAQNEPTSGFGKLILGESLISIGNNQIGIKLNS